MSHGHYICSNISDSDKYMSTICQVIRRERVELLEHNIQGIPDVDYAIRSYLMDI